MNIDTKFMFSCKVEYLGVLFSSSVDTDLHKFPKHLHSLMGKLIRQSKMNKISFHRNIKLSTWVYYLVYSSVDTDLHQFPKHLHSLMGKLMGQSKMKKILFH